MMGETDGSSTAAQSAQDEDESNRGFLGRLIDVFAGPEPPQAEDAGETARDRAAKTGLANLTQLSIEDVMVPKVEIVSLPIDADRETVVQVFRDSGLTRIPVYDGTLDSPKGLIHLKDFALKYGFDAEGNGYDLAKMLRPLLYAPPSMPIGVLLQKMQADRKHMALVIDEYGGVDGLVTLEDLVETVIGEIEDEIGLKLVEEEDEEEIDTLGGLVFMLAGRVPARGEIVPHPDGPNFEVVDADPRRIKRLRVRLSGAAAAE